MKKFASACLALFMTVVTPTWAQLPQSAVQMQMSFAPLVKNTAPAVVNIYTKRVVKERVNPFMNDPFFNQFFNMPNMGGIQRDRVEKALGSGVLVDASGVIATNNHVVKAADEIKVMLKDGREFDAKKVLTDPKVDLAILRIDTKGEKMPFLTFRDSDTLEVGDLVLAIGNPFGIGQTVTSGIVSGLARTDVGISDYGFFIQTDAAINPGNSGGALVDMNGRLAGINTAIFSRDGGSLGIGFAIPANMVQRVVETALRGGKKVVHPWTGVAVQNLTSDIAENLGLQKTSGALVSKVTPRSPADKAGIKAGDVILSLNDKEIQDTQAMKYRLATFAIGTPIKATLWRNGNTVDVSLTTVAPPENADNDRVMIQGRSPFSGATVANISPEIVEQLGDMPQEEGVVIVALGDGNAASVGLSVGDVILALNRKKITTVNDLLSAIKSGNRRWQMQVWRQGQVITMMVSL